MFFPSGRRLGHQNSKDVYKRQGRLAAAQQLPSRSRTAAVVAAGRRRFCRGIRQTRREDVYKRQGQHRNAVAVLAVGRTLHLGDRILPLVEEHRAPRALSLIHISTDHGRSAVVVDRAAPLGKTRTPSVGVEPDRADAVSYTHLQW